MRLTIIGSGDAFGSGGRFNTCFHLAAGAHNVLIDCGASSHVAFRVHGIDPNTIDAIILSHLHGDHFGGIPFLLIDGQYLARRERALTIAGPPGTRDRVAAALEVFFPASSKTQWRFPLDVFDIPVGVPTDVLSLSVTSAEVVHFSGAPSTALRVTDGKTLLAYSGDTQWTDALLPVAAGADLFIVECYEYERELTGHMNWITIKRRLADLAARRVMVTHMNPNMLARLDEVRQSGVLIAEDGLALDV
jgi:ribonuclease BN (tRNA processing enzyme)